jgi:hypothetical protein
MFLYCFFALLAAFIIPWQVLVLCAVLAAVVTLFVGSPLLCIGLLILGGMIWLLVWAVRGVKRGVVAL